MERLTRVVTAAFVGVAGCLLAAAPAGAQGGHVSVVSSPQARVIQGTISGTVTDDGGGAVPGAIVSALGLTLASTVTDERGVFTLNQLPAGEYLLRAHMAGFAASGGTRVRVGNSPAVHQFQLRRLDAVVGTSGAGVPVEARPIIAAGFDLPRGTTADGDEAGDADHPHTETAWRLRHIKRSILKDAAPMVVLNGSDPGLPSGSRLGRAVGSAAAAASSLFTDFPFSGEVNFLTTGAVAPDAVLSATALPRGIAYLALTAPGLSGDWAIRAAMSEGDLSSWLVAGSFTSKPRAGHAYDFRVSYSTQEYLGGNLATLASVTDGSRNVGELYAADRWTIARALTLEYGARYAHYDYLEQRGLLSPSLALTVEPLARTRIRARAAQRMVAPGAEEFLAGAAAGPWLPPERTFAPLVMARGADGFRVERARSYDVTIERDLAGTFVVGVGRFHQSVDDQLVTIFGRSAAGGARSVGHYDIGSLGGFAADGWAVKLASPATAKVQGSVHYTLTRAQWSEENGLLALASLAVPRAALRAAREDLHDVTTSLSADIPETATRVYVLYKVNTGFVRSNTALDRPGLDGRFDLQVNQGLPVRLAGTEWEVLLGLRNLFRDPADAASVYDELLVVRPPKRVVGGFLVRF